MKKILFLLMSIFMISSFSQGVGDRALLRTNTPSAPAAGVELKGPAMQAPLVRTYKGARPGDIVETRRAVVEVQKKATIKTQRRLLDTRD